jgi:DNA helicase HerA-like ATPase
MSEPILVGKGENPVFLLPGRANRHGLIAGATGTGKTVTLQSIAENFSKMGVPVFLADVKGDLSGMAQAGGGKPKIEERATELGVPIQYAGNPVVFWDVFGRQGHPVRTTISEMGPLLLSRLMDLNETQEGVLNIAFKLADDEGLLLLDLKDLRAMLVEISERADEIQREYGNVSAATVGAIQRQLLVLEEQGGDQFFGEPALNLTDLMRTTYDGKGMVNILAADKLMQSPKLYATFLLWMLAELFETLPEIGDPEKPKLVFFFDEAHLLFNDAPKALQEKVEQVVRLIRSKGVGVYFITQNPADVPDSVLAQLGNRVQHALRAFTPSEMKGVRAAADSFRPNPKFKTEDEITNLGVGWALASMLDEKGTPTIVEKAAIRPPMSRLGPATPEERQQVYVNSPVKGVYETANDRESAYEKLKVKADAQDQAEAAEEAAKLAEKQRIADEKLRVQEEREAARAQRAASGGRKDSVAEAVLKSTMRAAGSQLGRQLIRGVLGNLFKGR